MIIIIIYIICVIICIIIVSIITIIIITIINYIITVGTCRRMDTTRDKRKKPMISFIRPVKVRRIGRK
jgi:hypothetical protein